jgi:putative NADH-flavin reductase
MSKVWLITGSSRGLGHSILEAALQDGAKVLATARDTAQFADLQVQYGERLATFELDVSHKARATLQNLPQDYQASLGDFKALIDAYVGHEVGDPERIAKLIVALASRATVPAHLVLGSDAWQVVEAEEQARRETTVTLAADFGAASPEWLSE